jgi:hypothetical protein
MEPLQFSKTRKIWSPWRFESIDASLVWTWMAWYSMSEFVFSPPEFKVVPKELRKLLQSWKCIGDGVTCK